jgi:hypothetical protein
MIRNRNGDIIEDKSSSFGQGTYDMNLNGLTLYAGHNTPSTYSSGYHNNCEVRYFKYFKNSICTES